MPTLSNNAIVNMTFANTNQASQAGCKPINTFKYVWSFMLKSSMAEYNLHVAKTRNVAKLLANPTLENSIQPLLCMAYAASFANKFPGYRISGIYTWGRTDTFGYRVYIVLFNVAKNVNEKVVVCDTKLNPNFIAQSTFANTTGASASFTASNANSSGSSSSSTSTRTDENNAAFNQINYASVNDSTPAEVPTTDKTTAELLKEAAQTGNPPQTEVKVNSQAIPPILTGKYNTLEASKPTVEELNKSTSKSWMIVIGILAGAVAFDIFRKKGKGK